jgi:hypothetical protein
MVSLQTAKRLVSLKNNVCIGSREILSVASASEGARETLLRNFVLLGSIVANTKADHGFLSNALMFGNPSRPAPPVPEPPVWPREVARRRCRGGAPV